MTFSIKNSPFLLFMLLIEKTNAAEHYEKTKFDLYKDDISLVLNLTYFLMNNFVLVLNIPWSHKPESQNFLEPGLRKFKLH